MRYDPNKAYLYPVLRPKHSDYPRAEFQVEVQDPERIKGTTALRITADYALSDSDLLELVRTGAARYVLRVRASTTRHRSAQSSNEAQIVRTFGDGQLHGLIQVWGFLAATRDLHGFRAAGWHDDYRGMDFDIQAGAVLAEDDPKEYWIDTAEEAPIGTFVVIGESEKVESGKWTCEIGGDRVTILMSKVDYQQFQQARNRLIGTPDGAYILNAVYLPALIWVLQEADSAPEEYGDCRWYRSLDA